MKTKLYDKSGKEKALIELHKEGEQGSAIFRRYLSVAKGFHDFLIELRNEVIATGDLDLPNFADQMFPEGSVGAIRQEIQTLQAAISVLWDPDDIEIYQQKIEELEEKLKKLGVVVTNEFDKKRVTISHAERAANRFASTIETGLANAVTSGKEFIKILDDIGRMLLRAGVQLFVSWAIGGMGISDAVKQMLGVQGLATGGDVVKSGVFDVGERGRERVFLPAGAAVRPVDSGAMKVEIDVTGTLVGRGDTLEAVIENVIDRRIRTARA